MRFIRSVLQAAVEPKRTLQRSATLALRALTGMNNVVIDIRRRRHYSPTGRRLFDEVAERALTRTDISDHLKTMFVEALAIRPSVIVELGVRGGESTFALERAAALCGSTLISVDIQTCLRKSQYSKWRFVQDNDVAFAKHFPAWCRDQQIPPLIDVLFVDTSHEYAHTLQEIDLWFPHLAPHSKVLFHDTNMRRLYFRKDGSMGVGWRNGRGVIAPLEQYLGRQFNEREDFVDWSGEWIVRHHQACSGLTILERITDQLRAGEIHDASLRSAS